MAIELKIPEVGESIVEVEIGDWLKKEGEQVEKDEPVVSLESEKATVELPAPDSGRISQILKQKGDTAKVGEVIGYLDKDGKQSAGNQKSEEKGQKREEEPKARTSRAEAVQPGGTKTERETDPKSVSENYQTAERTREKKASSPLPSPAEEERERISEMRSEQSERRVMPAAERGLPVEEIEPTGPGGRVLKEDVLRKPESPERPPAARAEAPSSAQEKPA